MSNHAGWLSVTLLVADYLTRGAFALRVIMRRLPPATSLAWLAVILLFPFVGAGIYLMFGELRLGRRRAERAKRSNTLYGRILAGEASEGQNATQRRGRRARTTATP